METKGEQTRRRIARHALELFERQGYDATSVRQVADAAGVSEMTFFRHFRAKEDVVLDDPFDPAIGAAIASQPVDLPPLVRATRGIRESWRALAAVDGAEVRGRIRIAAGSPVLRSAMHRNAARTERVIAEAVGGDGFAARIVAAATVAALTTALLEWSLTDDDTRLGTMIDTALDHLAVDHG